VSKPFFSSPSSPKTALATAQHATPLATSRDYPRDLAVRVLTRVLSDHEPLDEALAAISGEVTPTARAWLQEVCSGTLRWRGRLDQILDSTALKKKPSGWLRKILLIATYQLVVQERVQPTSVVNETVNEVKRKEGEAPANFANACLRKISEHGPGWRELQLRFGASALEGAAWASLPDWLWRKLWAQHGDAWARGYAKASLQRPVMWIRARDPSFSAEWAQAGPLPGSFQLTEGGAIFDKPGFAEGDFFVQDISSQKLVHEITTAVKAARPGQEIRALDLCAAPGGKSVGMAWSGLKVLASDRDSARYALLAKTLERVAPEVEIIPREKVAELSPLDLVWVDAPCTGTGILRRHPDVRWLRQEKDLAGLLKIQQKLLHEAWTHVTPGGFLAYSVCSVLKEEGPEALQEFLRAQVPGTTEFVGEWALVPQTAPYGDGFWAGLVRKTAPKI
jgi:16S rRNA (cytosine967-C5)-methyltransferase